MRLYRFVLLGLICAAPFSTAGQVYGTLRDISGKAIPGVEITIVSPAKVA